MKNCLILIGHSLGLDIVGILVQEVFAFHRSCLQQGSTDRRIGPNWSEIFIGPGPVQSLKSFIGPGLIGFGL